MTDLIEIASEGENTTPEIFDDSFCCSICEGEIRDGVEYFSCSISDEYFDDGAYTVTDSEGLTQICVSCQNKFRIIGKIEQEAYSCVGVSYRHAGENENIAPIHNMFDCYSCSKPIWDGERITTVTSSFETCNGNVVTVSEAWIVTIICKSCESSSNIREKLAPAIDNLVASARRRLINRVS